MNKLSNIKEALDFGLEKLSSAKIKNAKLDVEILLSEVLGLNKQQLYSRLDEELMPAQQDVFVDYISRRPNNEPIQYILGYAYFRGLKLLVREGVLIPRPETEMLVELALKELDVAKAKILDLCCGSGCIACSVANEVKDAKIVAVDVSSSAVDCAKENIEQLNLTDRVDVVEADMTKDLPIGNDFDMIICNPPYVPTEVYNNLDTEVLDFEPKLALEAGPEGLDYLPSIIKLAKSYLKTGGLIALELHENHVQKASEIAKKEGLVNIKTLKDLANKNRFLFALVI